MTNYKRYETIKASEFDKYVWRIALLNHKALEHPIWWIIELDDVWDVCLFSWNYDCCRLIDHKYNEMCPFIERIEIEQLEEKKDNNEIIKEWLDRLYSWKIDKLELSETDDTDRRVRLIMAEVNIQEIKDKLNEMIDKQTTRDNR